MCHAVTADTDDDERTVVTSNRHRDRSIVPVTMPRPHSFVAAAHHLFGTPSHESLNAITIDAQQAIADTGATSIFIMDGVDVDNKRVATNPITINLPDGRQVKSSHVCDFIIPGLPSRLVGHVVPGLAVASLVGIRPLCKAGCKVVFDDETCDVIFNGNVILRGLKDPSTDLWTLPIRTAKMWTDHDSTVVPAKASTKGDNVHPGVDLATFTHSVRTRGNGVKFAHQSLCNPKISTLLKAVRRGFLRGCPNMSEKLILKYLNPSPATAKGHMKRPRHGIRSTRRTTPPQLDDDGPAIPPIPLLPAIPHIPILRPNDAHIAPIEIIPAPEYFRQTYTNVPNIIDDDDDPSTANLFCSAAFADKVSGVVYSDLTGNFPFMSYDGNKCFLVVYHYETNAIMATPIAGLDDMTIFKAYKVIFQDFNS